MIPCVENCKFQIDGCCTLNGKATVTNSSSGCPFYKEKTNKLNEKTNELNKNINSFFNGSDINKFNS